MSHNNLLAIVVFFGGALLVFILLFLLRDTNTILAARGLSSIAIENGTDKIMTNVRVRVQDDNTQKITVEYIAKLMPGESRTISLQASDISCDGYEYEINGKAFSDLGGGQATPGEVCTFKVVNTNGGREIHYSWEKK